MGNHLREIDGAAERAERRRAVWTGGVAGSFAELQDIRPSIELTAAARFGMIWSLVTDTLVLRGEDGPTPRLQRSVGGIRPFGS